MKSFLLLSVVFGLSIHSARSQNEPNLNIRNQKINYAFGMDIISTFKQQNFSVNQEAFLAGIQDSLAGKSNLSADQQKAALKELGAYLEAQEMARRKLTAIKDLQEGQEFLTANAKKEGVKIKSIALPDGSSAELQYKILKSGSGPSPKKNDIVEVHYVGTRLDGTVFDSSIQRGTPATFGVADVIPGWTEALQMMKAGDKWELFIPPNLAYGEFGPPQIAPNSTLIFQLELLSFYTPSPTNKTSIH